MDFANDTYIVLDIPQSELTNRILEIRRGSDPWRANLPVEITITGSGGIGVIDKGESLNEVCRKLAEIARATSPISIIFDRIEVFPNTNLYHFRARNDQELIDLHDTIKHCGIRFGSSNFPFVPHCTIANLNSDGNDTQIERIRALDIPQHEIALMSMSVYSLGGGECILRNRWTLGDQSQRP